MATLITVDVFAKDLLDGLHKFGTDVFKLALSNTAIAASVTNLSGITEIATGGGYTTGGGLTLTCATSTPATGQGAATFVDLVFAASGTVPQFRYGLIHNTSATPANRAVAVFDTGGAVNLTSGQQYTFDFQGSSILVG